LFDKTSVGPPTLPSIDFLRSDRGRSVLHMHVSLFGLYESSCIVFGKPMSISLKKLTLYGTENSIVYLELMKHFQWRLSDGLNCIENAMVYNVACTCRNAFKEFYAYKKNQLNLTSFADAIEKCIEYTASVTNGDDCSLSELCDTISGNDLQLMNTRSIMLATAKYSPEFLRKSRKWCDDREIVMEAVRSSGVILKYASDRLRGDKQLVITAVRRYGPALKFASRELQNDREVVLSAVREKFLGYEALRYAQKAFKDDKKIVLNAIETNGYALEHASDKLRADREIVTAAVRSNGKSLEYASDELRDDIRVVLIAVSKRGDALEFASERLRNNREVVMTAVQSKGHSLVWVSDELHKDRDVVIAAIRNCYDLDVIRYFHRITTIPPELKNDRDVVLEMMKFSGKLEQASARLRNDYQVVMTAVERDPTAIQYASRLMKDDKDIIRMAIRADGLLLRYASTRLRNCRDIVHEAVRENSEAIKYASKDLQKFFHEYPALRSEKRRPWPSVYC
jgi:hypothetical protein